MDKPSVAVRHGNVSARDSPEARQRAAPPRAIRLPRDQISESAARAESRTTPPTRGRPLRSAPNRDFWERAAKKVD